MENHLHQNKFVLELNHFKDILLHSLNNRDCEVEITVQPSRFKSILTELKNRTGSYVEGFVESACEKYDFFRFNSKEIGDNNNNIYTIIQDRNIKEKKRQCSECDCNSKRFVNEKTGVCFYKEMISNNYTTKIKDYVTSTKKT